MALHLHERTDRKHHRSHHKAMPLGRAIAVAGALAVALAAVLPWVTVRGSLPVDLGVLGAEVTAGGRTVTGGETAAWPFLLGIAAVVAVLAGLGIARAKKLLLAVGALATAAGGVLYYYLSNVIDIETSGRSPIERAAADLALTSSVGPGPYALILGGILISVGALTLHSKHSKHHHR